MTAPPQSSDPPPAKRRLAFYGGWAGALAPLAVFLAGVAWLGFSGAPDERGFWPVLLGAIAVGTLLARDRSAYAETVVRGMSRPLVGLMILAWMLAGVLASLLTASGFIDALVALLTRAQLSGGAYVAAAFLIACVLSTATGTSLGTLILAVPLLYPPGGALGAHPPVLLAALLAGATFGDNLSPVSDTTIASAGTQGAAMGQVVRSRLRYAVPAGLFSLVLFAILGSGHQTVAVAGDEGSLSPAALSMAAAPALIFVLLLFGRHLLVSMLAGSALAIVLGVAGSLFAWSELLYLDRDSFVARGLLADGLERSVGVSILTLLLMGVAAGLEESGLLDRMVESARRRAQSARQAELWIFAATSVAVILTTHAAVAILTVGDLARETGEAHRIAPERRANLIDVTVCTYPFLLPFFIPTILAGSLSQSGADYGMPRISAAQAGLLNFHSWALLALILAAIATGWGRRVERSPG